MKSHSKPLLSTLEVAENLFGTKEKKHYERVLKLIHQGEIKSVRIGGSFYVKSADLRAWINGMDWSSSQQNKHHIGRPANTN